MMKDAAPAIATRDGFRLEAVPRASGAWKAPPGLVAEIARSAAATMWIGAPGQSARVGVRRLGAGEGQGELRRNVVRFGAGRDVETMVFARAAEIEELTLLRHAASSAYAIDLPKGWSLRHVAAAPSVEIRDDRGEPALRMRADRAWDAHGRALGVSLALDGDVVRVAIDPAGVEIAYPIVVDPTWTTAAAPIRIHSGHTATLLGNGQVLVAGGGSVPDATEIFDPHAARFVVGPTMLAKRTRHTATLLLSGRVLLAGGDATGSCELYDPVTGAFTATGALSVARARHAAVRLPSGKVLVVGGGAKDDITAEIYDPVTGTFAPAPKPLPSTNDSGTGPLVVLPSGKVLFVSAGKVTLLDGGTDPGRAQIFDPTALGGAGAWSFTSPPATAAIFRLATPLRDGTALLTTVEQCVSAIGNSAIACRTQAQLFDPAAQGGQGAFGPLTPDFPGAVGPASAALLPTGEVLFAGGSSPLGTQIYHPGTGNVTADENMANPHADVTATVLPGGDVLVVGGTQAAVDLRMWPGRVTDIASTMSAPRMIHSAVRLRSGNVLIAGGLSHQPTPQTAWSSADIYDAQARTFAPTGAMTVPRVGPSMTLLASGKVLVAGGEASYAGPALASADVYDPATATFHAAGSLSGVRPGHAAALLVTGEVLVTGGVLQAADSSKGVVETQRDTTELFDPVTETFRAGPKLTAPHARHGMVRLPTGKVLVVGDASAELYDPTTRTFAATAAPGAARDGTTARLLPTGKVLISGGTALANELYDPVSETWSFTAPRLFPDLGVAWTNTADGRVLSSGGYPGDGVEPRMVLFDPLAVGNAASDVTDAAAHVTGRGQPSSTLASTGAVVIAGGDSCNGGCIGPVRDTAVIWDDGAPPSARPIVSGAPATVRGGEKITLTGSGFANGPSQETPVAVWLSEAGDAVVPGRVLDFSDTQVAWVAPSTALYGHGWLYVAAGGVLSRGVPLEIASSAQATACAHDAECTSGFCTDGVCCDRRCDGACEGCTAAHKTQGADGVCGAVPPGHDINKRCFALQGAACKDAVECATGFCTEGVCCDSSCQGTCLSCTQPNQVGHCGAINQGACDVACDGDHTLKKVGAPDTDCAPFKCDGKQCRLTCASAKECVPESVCSLEGLCVAAVNAPPSSESVWGCAVGRAASTRTRGLWAAFAFALMAGRKLRRRGRPR